MKPRYLITVGFFLICSLFLFPYFKTVVAASYTVLHGCYSNNDGSTVWQSSTDCSGLDNSVLELSQVLIHFSEPVLLSKYGIQAKVIDKLGNTSANLSVLGADSSYTGVATILQGDLQGRLSGTYVGTNDYYDAPFQNYILSTGDENIRLVDYKFWGIAPDSSPVTVFGNGHAYFSPDNVVNDSIQNFAVLGVSQLAWIVPIAFVCLVSVVLFFWLLSKFRNLAGFSASGDAPDHSVGGGRGYHEKWATSDDGGMKIIGYDKD